MSPSAHTIGRPSPSFMSWAVSISSSYGLALTTSRWVRLALL